MDAVERRLRDPVTYRRLIFLLSAVPLGLVWFVALVTVWSLCLGLVITPFVIPLLLLMAAMTRGFGAVEAEIARSLLDVDAQAPPGSVPGEGFWAALRSMFGAGFWRAQGYLLIRWFVGFPVGIAVLSVVAGAIGLIFAPVWVPFSHGGLELGIWRPHTFLQSLALVPLGVVLLPASLLVVPPLASLFRPVVSALLPGGATEAVAPGMAPPVAPRIPPRRALTVHAAGAGSVVLGLVLLWALTSLGYFWPVWVVLPLAAALAIHGWFVLIDERPSVLSWFRGSRAVTSTAGVGAVIGLFLIAVWAITSRGYFWPIWPIAATGAVLAILTVAALLASPDQAEMAERIETLESTRAGAVDLQDTELRRIERDLHDGAQARLVALGMSLGMAEQKLSDDPQRAGELLAEAREGAEHALRELRGLARGIHPPVLADRGLEAALLSLANSSPLKVTLSIRVQERPPPVVESAAYFVAAEALANAAKHARAETVAIQITRVDHTLELEVTDDGVGGADPEGAGLLGLRQRVAALDGVLEVTSPPGGPTTVRAQLPCG